MENVINQPHAASTGKIVNVILWILQIAAAAMFLMAGFAKLSGDPKMVGLFDTIGVGQWFRYLTGGLEVGSSVLLLIPRTSGLGAAILIPVMIGAIMTHLFIVGGSPAIPVVLLIIAIVVAIARRSRTLDLLLGK